MKENGTSPCTKVVYMNMSAPVPARLEDASDIQLVQASLEHKEAFTFIMQRYKDPLRRYIKRLTSFSEDIVDDILQEIFIKAYVHLRDFDQTLRFSSWLYRITHNETVSYFRKNKKHIDATNALDDDDLHLFASEINIEQEHQSKEFASILAVALRELPEHYRAVLVLKFIEGKDYETISDILQKPPGTVATWINRAKKELRTILIKKGIETYV